MKVDEIFEAESKGFRFTTKDRDGNARNLFVNVKDDGENGKLIVTLSNQHKVSLALTNLMPMTGEGNAKDNAKLRSALKKAFRKGPEAVINTLKDMTHYKDWKQVK